MTGITKDEVIRMAGEAGMNSLSLIDIGYLERFTNVVLERAAVEMDGAWHTAEAARSVRALKNQHRRLR